MGTLETVLEYKKQKAAKASADLQAIPVALQTFTAARQAANQTTLQRLQMESTLAPQGYRIGMEGGRPTIVKDPGMMSDANLLDIQEKQAKIGEMNSNKKFIDEYMTRQGAGGDGGTSDGGGLEFTGVQGGKPKFDRVTDSDIYKRGVDLSQKFYDDKTVKDYDLVRNQVSTMQGMFEQAKKGDAKSMSALDDALISTWKKVLDPTSVIMVQEYATATKNRPLLNKFESAIKKVNKGDLLAPADREALMQGAYIVANQRGSEFNRTYDRYAKIGERGKVGNLKDFLGDKHADFDLGSLNKGAKESGTPEFSTVREANAWGAKAKPKPGTKIIIGGIEYEWEE